MATFTIYTIRHKATGKLYVGQTSQKPAARWRAHCSRGCGAGRSAIKAAIIRDGKDSFEFSVVASFQTLDEANVEERRLIAELCTLSPHGYNLEAGGREAYGLSDETRRKMSEAAKGRSGRGSRKQEDAAKAPSRTRSEAASARKRGPYKLSQEACKNISLSKLGNRCRATKVIRSDGVVFDTVNDAATALGVLRTSVSRVLGGQRKSIAGYGFSYARKEG
jgi:group I intron endonuclease